VSTASTPRVREESTIWATRKGWVWLKSKPWQKWRQESRPFLNGRSLCRDRCVGWPKLYGTMCLPKQAERLTLSDHLKMPRCQKPNWLGSPEPWKMTQGFPSTYCSMLHWRMKAKVYWYMYNVLCTSRWNYNLPAYRYYSVQNVETLALWIITWFWRRGQGYCIIVQGNCMGWTVSRAPSSPPNRPTVLFNLLNFELGTWFSTVIG
jgi:hypothetical protein